MIYSGAILLGILSYRREGSPPPVFREPSPGEWGAWSGRVYSGVVRRRAFPPSPGVAEVVGGRVINRMVDTWERVVSYHRKETSLFLFQLALERAEATGLDGWHSQAERWQKTYQDLPGGDPPETSRMIARLEDLRLREKVFLLEK